MNRLILASNRVRKNPFKDKTYQLKTASSLLRYRYSIIEIRVKDNGETITANARTRSGDRLNVTFLSRAMAQNYTRESLFPNAYLYDSNMEMK